MIQERFIRSDASEIIGAIPKGVALWGPTILLLTLVVLATMTFIIKYPDTLKAEAIITTETAPITLISRANGNLILIRKDRETVKAGEIIAYLDSDGVDIYNILNLEKALINNQIDLNPLKSNVHLGELEEVLIELRAAIQKERALNLPTAFESKFQHLQRQHREMNAMEQSLTKLNSLAKRELTFNFERFRLDSILHIERVVSDLDFNKSKTLWIQQQTIYENTLKALITNRIQSLEIDGRISDLMHEKETSLIEARESINNIQRLLLSKIAQWKSVHLFIAPISGEIAYIGVKGNHQYTSEGESVISILPHESKLVAHAELPIYNSGKIKVGQRAVIKLNNYPYEQYGNLEGTLVEVSSIPFNGKYHLKILLGSELITNHEAHLVFKQQMTGTTEIVTEELRLSDRLLYQLRSLIKMGPDRSQ